MDENVEIGVEVEECTQETIKKVFEVGQLVYTEKVVNGVGKKTHGVITKVDKADKMMTYLVKFSDGSLKWFGRAEAQKALHEWYKPKELAKV